MKPSPQSRPVRVCGSAAARPLMRDFIGLNETHMPDLKRAREYRAVGRLARDYHSASSDLGTDSKFAGPFGLGRDQRDWKKIYRDLAAADWRVIVSVMFERL